LDKDCKNDKLGLIQVCMFTFIMFILQWITVNWMQTSCRAFEWQSSKQIGISFSVVLCKQSMLILEASLFGMKAQHKNMFHGIFTPQKEIISRSY